MHCCIGRRTKINNKYEVFKSNGSIKTGDSLEHFLLKCAGLPIGEIYLTSIDRDGTGNGLNLEMLDFATHINEVPLILMGGVGNADHIIAGLRDNRVDAVATANLLNFMGDGLLRARESAIAAGINLPLLIPSRISKWRYFREREKLTSPSFKLQAIHDQLNMVCRKSNVLSTMRDFKSKTDLGN